MGDSELAHEILESFLEEAPKQLKALGEALETGDAAAVAARAHTLKGSFSAIGSAALEVLAREIEHAARAGEVQIRQLPELEARFEDFRREAEACLVSKVFRRPS